MKKELVKDALGSLLHKFFTRHISTYEQEESLVAMLWQAVSWYRATGEFSVAIIVCPEYNQDYTRVLSGASTTALRAIELFKLLKKCLGRHIRYAGAVKFQILLFDQEQRQFEHMGIMKEQVEIALDTSVVEIRKKIRQSGILPDCFTAGRFIGNHLLDEWQRVFNLSQKFISDSEFQGTEPFCHPRKVFKGLTGFYTRVMNTTDTSAHWKMFIEEEGPGYLSAGHVLRKNYGAHILQVDLGSNLDLSRMNLWQPKGEELIERPSLIRIKNPSMLNPSA
jgi:hypothetical protein